MAAPQPQNTKPSSLFRIVTMLITIGKFIGAVSFSSPNPPQNKTVKILVVDYVTLIGSLLTYSCLIYLNIVNDIHEMIAVDSNLLAAISRTSVISILLLGIWNNVENFYNRNNIWKVVLLLFSFDNQIYVYGGRVENDKEFKIIITYAIICITTGLGYMLLTAFVYRNYMTFPEMWPLIITYTVMFSVYLAETNVYIIGVYSVYKRLKAINETIILQFGVTDRTLLHLSDNRTSAITDQSAGYISQMIAQLADAYSKLVVSTRMFNDFFAIEVLILFTVAFAYGICTMYTLYEVYMSFSSRFALLSALSFGWTLLFSIPVCLAIFLGSGVQNQSQMIPVYIHKTLNKWHIPSIEDCLRQFSLQLHQCPVKMTCGYFDFDWTLLFTIAAATGTYLTILLQFADPSMNVVTESYDQESN